MENINHGNCSSGLPGCSSVVVSIYNKIIIKQKKVSCDLDRGVSTTLAAISCYCLAVSFFDPLGSR